MMGHQSRQMAMIFVDIESLIPETHLLRNRPQRSIPRARWGPVTDACSDRIQP